ncbi:MAG TPA: Sec-independent protein translocase subunit TatA [Nocardioidaceae bacterium]|nr:Sec-independent protein translocase subunit TatA [Nocardioidaceae bacterium]
MIGTPGPWEIALIVFVLILLFGAKKLPDLARGSGRALRIFKSETRGLMEDDDDKDKTDEHEDRPRPLTTGGGTEPREQTSPQGSEQPNATSDSAHRPHES